MLYKIEEKAGVFQKLDPVEFKDFSSFGKLEKDLENLIANSILDVLFEDAKLMPIFQERQWQAEADIYALNERGELVIFELKRASAGKDAVHQALRYAQDAGQWTYQKLARKFEEYSNSTVSLVSAHREAFSLEHELEPKEINNNQHLLVIGSAADESLISSVDYWKKNGISIDFLPYRVYELAGQKHFEFFALPYDIHKNPSDVKGVLFDTNRSWDESSIWSMMENSRVEAYGDAKRFVHHVHVGDIVFFSHKWCGLIAAAKVKSEVKTPDSETLYRDVEFLTPIPSRQGGKLLAMPFSEVSSTTGKSFFWARTIKVPYLTKNEALELVEELNKYLRRK
ncbi:hypothetical protein CBP31_01510 [Oceanisphaera profunda]|uniref:DUF91 domain-containing protein n=1 Tax=Oceanisphaera profunda TaxID=1416627 RepID=A0A1Y0D1U3_9GAMM|nr:hypothetical protein [Oceanisphaera profunda]ART81473.1 hypothetical protein CBP31_01510 [Oceanisphaera profunda]